MTIPYSLTVPMPMSVIYPSHIENVGQHIGELHFENSYGEWPSLITHTAPLPMPVIYQNGFEGDVSEDTGELLSPLKFR